MFFETLIACLKNGIYIENVELEGWEYFLSAWARILTSLRRELYTPFQSVSFTLKEINRNGDKYIAMIEAEDFHGGRTQIFETKITFIDCEYSKEIEDTMVGRRVSIN